MNTDAHKTEPGVVVINNGSETLQPLSLAQVQQCLASLIVPIDQTEQVPLANSYKRVLAEAVVSPIAVPSHNNSAMDGYACRFADLQNDKTSELTVIGSAFAGRPFIGALPAGTALRIMTGAVLPPELDTVVVQERCTVDGKLVHIPPGQTCGQHVRMAGEDLAHGALALPAGRWLQAADIGLLASLGLLDVRLRRRPKVAVFSTGDELLQGGQTLNAGQIFDSNRLTILSLLRELGIEADDLGIVPDQPAALRDVLQRANCYDVMLSSGGVSVGEADFTRSLLSELGEIVFSTLAIRPGRPLAFGRIGNCYYFGLPGNPVAVMVTYLFVVRDAIARVMGAVLPPVISVQALCDSQIAKRPGRTEYQRAIAARAADGRLTVRLTGQQGSGVLSSMSQANCMIVLAPEQGTVAAGQTVQIVLFEGLL